jgi:D-arabinose 1-dehydrogenase-like Zn-dependent alcohol dehydrogenase
MRGNNCWLEPRLGPIVWGSTSYGPNISTDSAGKPLEVGDRIVCTYFQACRHCPECFNGNENVCRNAYLSSGAPADQAPHFTGTFGTHSFIRANHASCADNSAHHSREAIS